MQHHGVDALVAELLTQPVELDVPKGPHRVQKFVAPRDGFLGTRLVANS